MASQTFESFVDVYTVTVKTSQTRPFPTKPVKVGRAGEDAADYTNSTKRSHNHTRMKHPRRGKQTRRPRIDNLKKRTALLVKLKRP
jgi:hypothetical protein